MIQDAQENVESNNFVFEGVWQSYAALTFLDNRSSFVKHAQATQKGHTCVWNQDCLALRP